MVPEPCHKAVALRRDWALCFHLCGSSIRSSSLRPSGLSLMGLSECVRRSGWYRQPFSLLPPPAHDILVTALAHQQSMPGHGRHALAVLPAPDSGWRGLEGATLTCCRT